MKMSNQVISWLGSILTAFIIFSNDNWNLPKSNIVGWVDECFNFKIVLKYFGYDKELNLVKVLSEVHLKQMKAYNYLFLKPDFQQFLRNLFILFSKKKQFLSKQDFLKICFPAKGSSVNLKETFLFYLLEDSGFLNQNDFSLSFEMFELLFM